jgi:putative PIN family toxin of toxin-antitoxin system
VASPLVVLDTNVLVAAIRSRRGASFRLLTDELGSAAFEIAVSVPLVLEYEDAMLRRRGPLGTNDVRDVIDYVCSVARHQNIFFLWRPLLRDPKDDMVAEVAVASGAEAIVTHNRRDFMGVERFGVTVLSPGEFLKQVRGVK